MMKKLILAAAFAAFASPAFAGQMEGKVEAIDETTRTILLDDGSSYIAAEGVEISGLAAGDTVVVTYDDGTNNATAVDKL